MISRFILMSVCWGVLAWSCATKPTYPTANAHEKELLREYRDGEITWSEYQDRLKHESATAEDGP